MAINTHQADHVEYIQDSNNKKHYLNAEYLDGHSYADIKSSVANHYSPTANSDSELTATISGTAGAYAKDKEYTVLTGIKAQRDAKGHVTGLTYTAQKIKDTNTTYTFNGAVSTIKDSNLTASRALISDNNGKIAISDVTSAELSYLDGVTSSIQTQLNAKLDKTTYE